MCLCMVDTGLNFNIEDDGYIHCFKVVDINNQTGDMDYQLVKGNNIDPNNYEVLHMRLNAGNGTSYGYGFHCFQKIEDAIQWRRVGHMPWNEKIVEVLVHPDNVVVTGLQNDKPVVVAETIYIESFDEIAPYEGK